MTTKCRSPQNMVWFQEGDVAMMAAQQYYVENGANLDPRVLSNLLPNYIPNHFLKSGADKGLSRWEKLVADAFQKVNSRHIFSTNGNAFWVTAVIHVQLYVIIYYLLCVTVLSGVHRSVSNYVYTGIPWLLQISRLHNLIWIFGEC